MGEEFGGVLAVPVIVGLVGGARRCEASGDLLVG